MRSLASDNLRQVLAVALLPLALVGGLLLFCWGLYRHEAGLLERSLFARESVRVDALARLFEHQIHTVANDLRKLANSDGLRAYLASGRSTDLDQAIQQAAFFSRLNLDIDQIVLLNEQGREVLRVNQNGHIVPPAELQDKSDRSYFQKTFKLAPGQMYLRALDLNVDHGQIELPPKPVLRLAMPVFDAAGRCRGIYLINCLVHNYFSYLQEYRPDIQYGLRVFNAQGYWLKAAKPEQELGFMFPERADLTLSRTAPKLWAELADQPHGQTRHAGGVISWQRIDLRQLVAGKPDSMVAEDAFLVIASEISEQEFGALFAYLKVEYTILAALLLTSALFAWRLFYSRRLAYEELHRSEESLAVTLHSIGDAVLATDPAGRVTRLNSVAEKLMGWKQAEAQGRPIAEVFHLIDEETRQPAVIPVDKVLATAEIHGLAKHKILIARDGSERPIADTAAPIRDKAGKILGVVLVFRDVTEEYAGQRALRDSEERMRLASKGASIGVWEWDIKSDAVKWDERMFAIYGLPQSPDGRGNYEDWRARVLPADLAAQEAQLQRTVDTGGQGEREFRIVRASDQAVRFIQAAEQAVAGADGQVVRVVGINIDITDRKQAQERVNESLKALSELKSALDEHAIVAITDARGKITYVNDKFCAISKYPCEELIGQDHRIINSGHHPKEFIRDLWQTITSGRVWKGEIKNRAKDGSFYWVYTTIVPFFGVDGKPVQFIAIRADITKRKEGEERIKHLLAELAGRAAQLESANKELESFSYSVSHDLRAPLRHVQGYAEMLTRAANGQLSDKARRYLKTISEASTEMGQLIDGLIAFSRTNRTEVRETEFSMDELLRESIAIFETTVQGRNIEWRIEPLPQVMGDPILLRQVLTNLVGNAIKYTRQRGTAQIEIGCDGGENGRITFFVRDNGAGFDMRYAHKLFGVFQRLHRADEFEGTGIGLASAQRIIARHGGRMWAKGKTGEGATFYFTLKPAARGQS